VTTYTTGCYRTLIRIPCGGLRSGFVTNSFDWVWFSEGSPAGGDLTNLMVSAADPYHTTVASHQGWYYYMSGALDRTSDVCEVAVFTVNPIGSDPEELGPPIATANFTLGAASGEGAAVEWPNQVAACISWRSDYGTDEEYGTHVRPRADDRGRIFLGPLNGACAALTGVGLEYPCLSTACVADLGLNYAAMVTTASSYFWIPAVWSRKEKVFKAVTDYAVNNHFDTQRRRGSIVPSLSWTSLA
jgi:hypothetical protein